MSRYYLEDHPPVRAQGRSPRRQYPRTVVLHTSETPPDWHGADGNAEKLAAYIQRRSTAGSYHSTNDRDSTIDLWNPETTEAFGARYGYNQFAIHHSFATQAREFRDDSGWWDNEAKTAIALRGATKVAEHCDRFGIPPVLLTKEQVDAGQSGVTTHHRLDPERRYDPGFSEIDLLAFLKVVKEEMQPSERHVTNVVDPSRPKQGGQGPFWAVYSNGRVDRHNGARALHFDLSTVDLNAPVDAAFHERSTDTLIMTASGDGGWFELQPTR